MTTTVSVKTTGQLALPKSFCQRKNIKPGTALRVTEVGEGLYVTPIPEPTESELRQVIAAARSLTHKQTPEEEEIVRETVSEVRAERRRQGR